MIDNQKDLINSSENEQDIGKPAQPFFSPEGINNISPNARESIQGERINRNEILNYIRKHAPITKYQLAKDLNIAYTTIATIIKEFEFCQLIKIKIVLGDNNRTHALICLEDEHATN